MGTAAVTAVDVFMNDLRESSLEFSMACLAVEVIVSQRGGVFSVREDSRAPELASLRTLLSAQTGQSLSSLA